VGSGETSMMVSKNDKELHKTCPKHIRVLTWHPEQTGRILTIKTGRKIRISIHPVGMKGQTRQKYFQLLWPCLFYKCPMMQHCVLQFSTICYNDKIYHNDTLYIIMIHNVAQCSIMPHNVAWYCTILHNVP
jgi:hypothetical protein